MAETFPKDYEASHTAQKYQLTQRLKKERELTALSIALHAHDIHAYLKQQGADNPNELLVDAFKYAVSALGVPYQVIDEAFYTQTPLTEAALFAVSFVHNPAAPKPKQPDWPLIEITIDFETILKNFFKELPASFWESFHYPDVLLANTDPQAYDLAALFQALLEKVWLQVKAGLGNASEKQLKQAREMFLSYFYSNDRKHYRKETQEMLLDYLAAALKAKTEEQFIIDQELQQLLNQKQDPGKEQGLKIAAYIHDHWQDWIQKAFYQRFLRSIPKTSNLSLLNQLLLLYQRSEVVPVKEIYSWTNEHRNLKEQAQPLFLFGANEHKIEPRTGEILQEKRLAFMQEELLLVPYFEVSDTEGRTTEPFEVSPQEIFVALEKMIARQVVFAPLEEAMFDDYTIRLRTGQNEKQTLTDFIVLLIMIEKQETDPLLRFENQSVADMILMVLGLELLPLDYTVLDNLQTVKNGKVYVQQLFTQVVQRSERFLMQLKEQLQTMQKIKAGDAVRPTLEEEIKEALEKQSNALANLATVQENKTNQSNKHPTNPTNLDEEIEQSKEVVSETAEGENDDRNN
ncbi:TPA: hypothetical protein ACGBG5_003035 [Enterococcus faecalis]